MRAAILICCVVVGVAFAGCAGDRGAGRAPARAEPVELAVTAPSDGARLRRGTAEVEGRVSPGGAEVTVLGRPALVTAGTFTVVVPLAPGANVIDVIATAPRRRPALRAVRVIRDVLVEVPDLVELAAADVEARLQPLGLRAEVQRGGGLLDSLRGGEPVVCEQEPAAGAQVRRGRVVTVVVARRC